MLIRRERKNLRSKRRQTVIWALVERVAVVLDAFERVQRVVVTSKRVTVVVVTSRWSLWWWCW